ncbi:protein ACCELERATED CELL DEATH 6 isoform X1 [Lactuca sativa]|uniref:PGG domain-containing protein n=1 Tax=Lactuca sativa TaxID=4236 RepID=A0A9R1V9F0_LACSA|nr:protein ACCELERATED CELL DEATH 6 isoform X1 [Lactuca sativa]XP_023765662.1 protein ACCELERATED CELL DEATH 6 isoform X1 [Lactuca sativa]KAJ0201239.1 hypothetical protein LSAT_V11C600341490 [Lactuca sativa]
MNPPRPLPPPSPSTHQQQLHLQHQQQNQDVMVQIPQQPPTHPNTHLPTLPENLPRLELINGNREEYLHIGVPLYEASIKGDWKAAEAILETRPELVRSAITENFETPLHIAASARSTKSVEEFVKNLVTKMEAKDLELQNKSSNTALSLAATAGNVETAKIMVKKNKAVLEIPGSQGMMPLYVAALFARDKMVRYLYYEIPNSMLGDYWKDENRGWVLQKCVEADLFDVALKIVNDYPKLTTNKRLLRDILVVLAKKTDAFKEKKPHIILGTIKSIFAVFHVKVGPDERESDALQLLKIIWKQVVIMPKKDIDDIIRGPPATIEEHKKKNTHYPSRVLFVAAKMGNIKFISELIRSYPDLIWKVDEKGLSMFHKAVKRRQEKIYNLLYEIGSMKDLITPIKDDVGNNMLHLVGKSAKPNRFQNVSGVALQMQRELLWFEEVKQIIPPSYRQKKNFAGEEPHDIFTKSHAKLVEKGEEWMKDTAAQCMVVATLIATIVFAAGFTLPGGYDQNNGLPMFGPRSALVVFVIADAISLIFSSTSVLIFLSILTSRYAERDFLESLPKKLMFGLGTLFLSIVTMMIAFGSSFFLLYHKNQKWIPYMVAGFAAIPVILFAFLQSRLLLDVFYSSYRSRYLFKPKKHTLYD